MKAADVLRAAADKLIQDGWQQGTYGPRPDRNVWNSPSGPNCIYGATLNADSRWMASHVYDEAENALLAKVLPLGFDGLPAWNDAPERTADEVIDLLLSVAADLEGAP